MIPIHDLLSRLRWDPGFAHGDVRVGYADHVAGGIVEVPLTELRFEPGDSFSFRMTDADGCERTIPLHRVRRVTRDAPARMGRQRPVSIRRRIGFRRPEAYP